MRGLLKGLWIILVIFTLSPLFGKWYKTSLVSKGLSQAAWCCWWFSLLFAETVFLQPTHQGGCETTSAHSVSESWSWVAIFRNVSLQKSLKTSGVLPRICLILLQKKNNQPNLKNPTKQYQVNWSGFDCVPLYLSFICSSGDNDC